MEKYYFTASELSKKADEVNIAIYNKLLQNIQKKAEEAASKGLYSIEIEPEEINPEVIETLERLEFQVRKTENTKDGINYTISFKIYNV